MKQERGLATLRKLPGLFFLPRPHRHTLFLERRLSFLRVALVGGHPPPRGQSSQPKPAGETGGRTRV
jgi:hypothetical protein